MPLTMDQIVEQLIKLIPPEYLVPALRHYRPVSTLLIAALMIMLIILAYLVYEGLIARDEAV